QQSKQQGDVIVRLELPSGDGEKTMPRALDFAGVVRILLLLVQRIAPVRVSPERFLLALGSGFPVLVQGRDLHVAVTGPWPAPPAQSAHVLVSVRERPRAADLLDQPSHPFIPLRIDLIPIPGQFERRADRLARVPLFGLDLFLVGETLVWVSFPVWRQR